MTLTADNIYNALSPRPVRFFERVHSTNDIALDWLREGAPSGAVVIADEQVKGRGRLGRAWYTPPGTALILSVVLRPEPQHLPHLTMMGALAVCELLERLSAEDVAVKWPNDVQLCGKKVSGVLPEVVWKGSQVEGAVLGIGVNVRIDFSGTEFADKAISIEPALGKSVNRLDLLVHLLNRLDDWTSLLGTASLYEAWRRRLKMLGQPVTVTGTDGTIQGVAVDVDEEGALLVRGEGERVHRVIAGDIVLGSVL
jgi:BirA family biotin operon repressor/biotin-[acetyl-CoA-carboxylase] ligase